MKYHKVIFSFVLFLSLFWNTFYVSLTYAYYFINRSGFIEQFCENIDKPEMRCNGKCHLKNVVEKKTTKEDNPVNMVVLEETNLYFKNIEDFDLDFKSIEIKEEIDRYINTYSFSINFLLDRPPEV